MRDFLGNEIVRGDIVFYGARSGNSTHSVLAVCVDPEKRKVQRVAERKWSKDFFDGGAKTSFGCECIKVHPAYLNPEDRDHHLVLTIAARIKSESK